MTGSADPPLRAETLGELLLIQGMVANLPYTMSIMQIVSNVIESFPGVGRVGFRIGTTLRSSSATPNGLRSRGAAANRGCNPPTLFAY